MSRDRPLVDAAVDWTHAAFRRAVARTVESEPERASVSVTSASIVDFLEPRAARTVMSGGSNDVDVANEALSHALVNSDTTTEPPAIASEGLGLSALVFRVLPLGQELDPRHQHRITLLMDDVGRRVWSLGLYMELLGERHGTVESLRTRATNDSGRRWISVEGHVGTKAS